MDFQDSILNTNVAQFNDFSIAPNGYAAFDALSLKSLIISRLNQNNVLTDQNYEGSNISSIIDIIAYSYHTLLFYLNRTAGESTFSTAELYENVNKIVKLLNYNPTGNQTSIVSFNATATANLPPQTYTIPRYSYFTLNGTFYSFNDDSTFTKATSGNENLSDFQSNTLLYQGVYQEYPIYNATGEPFEVLTLALVDNTGTNITIDHFNIDVYVKDNSVANPTWLKWDTTPSLFLENANATKYEIRLNENLRYEIKFGNSINGKQLNAGDQVAVYYLKSDGIRGEIGPGILNQNTLFFFQTNQFNQIQIDTTSPNINLITPSLASNISFINTDPSTPFVGVESVDSIKANATNTFLGQYRLITADDFTNYIKKNYGNIIGSVKVVNNWDYISGHVKYFFDLGVSQPNLQSRIQFNQVKFADSCNFSNIYIYAIPKLQKLTSLTTRANYLNSAQKQLITNDVNPIKILTSEVVINDPVYVTVDLGVQAPGEDLTPDAADNTFLQITRDLTAKTNPQAILQQVYNIFISYFATTNDNLGALISLTDLTNQILSIEGVLSINTVRTINGQVLTNPGISLIVYNPVYSDLDIQQVTQNYQLPYYKFPFLNNVIDFNQKIQVVTNSLQTLITGV